LVPLTEVTGSAKLSLFDNEPVSHGVGPAQPAIITVRGLAKPVPPPRTNNFKARQEKSTADQYSQFSTLQEDGTYKLHGQSPDGKNTQIIINLSNEPKSWLVGSGSGDGSKQPRGPDFGPPSPSFGFDRTVSLDGRFIGPPAPPTERPEPTVPPITLPPVVIPPLPTTTGGNGYGAPPTNSYATPSFDPAPSFYGTYQAPAAQNDPPPIYNPPPPQAPPRGSYGAPQASPQGSYGAPQAPPVQQQTAPHNYGAPQQPQAEPPIQMTPQVIPHTLSLSLTPQFMRVPAVQRAPPSMPSYGGGSPQNDAFNSGAVLNNPGGGDVHYHVHVQDLNDVQQLDAVFQQQQQQQQQSQPPQQQQQQQQQHQYGQLSAPQRTPLQRAPQRRPRQRAPAMHYGRRPPLQRDSGFGSDTSRISEWMNLKCFVWCRFNQAQFERNKKKK
jgi:hypothetical protein